MGISDFLNMREITKKAKEEIRWEEQQRKHNEEIYRTLLPVARSFFREMEKLGAKKESIVFKGNKITGYVFRDEGRKYIVTEDKIYFGINENFFELTTICDDLKRDGLILIMKSTLKEEVKKTL